MGGGYVGHSNPTSEVTTYLVPMGGDGSAVQDNSRFLTKTSSSQRLLTLKGSERELDLADRVASSSPRGEDDRRTLQATHIPHTF